MATDTLDVNPLTKAQPLSILGNKRAFFWHLVQMVIAMEVGMAFYHLLMATVLAGTGLAALTKEYKLFGYWMMTAGMVLGMLSFMRYRRSTWRYCLEMTAAMLAPLGALTILVLCYWIPIQFLHGLGDPLMILAMAAFMLYRPHEYTHHTNEHFLHHSVEEQ